MPDGLPEEMMQASEALSAVMLEGPDEIYERALGVFHLAQEWWYALQYEYGDSSPGDTYHPTPSTDIGAATEMFLQAASRVLRASDQGLLSARLEREVSAPWWLARGRRLTREERGHGASISATSTRAPIVSEEP